VSAAAVGLHSLEHALLNALWTGVLIAFGVVLLCAVRKLL
jgi:hypothetical protein